MSVHRIYTIDGKEYHARNKIYDDNPRHYAITDDRRKVIGRVRKLLPRRFWVVGWDSVVAVADDCTSLKEAVTALVLELDRRAARRKATLVSWGEVIVPRVEPRVQGNGEIRHRVYDAGRPESEGVGYVSEMAPGQWQAKLTQVGLAIEWEGSPVSIRESLAAGVQDLVDVIAKGLRPPYQLGNDASDAGDDEDDEDERADDAVECPLADTPWHLGDACELCGGGGWVTEEAIEAHLRDNRVPCLNCGSEGEVSPGPVSFTCLTCLGTTRMPVAALAEHDLAQDPIHEQDWSGADLQGQDLRGATFVDCTFAGVNFTEADLADATFRGCKFSGAKPELAASLDGTRLQVEGLSEEQLAACIARGAVVMDADDVVGE